MKAEVLASVPSFKTLLTIIQDPRGRTDARQTLLSRAYEELGLMSTPPPGQERLLAHTMLVLLANSADEGWKHTIATVYAPNLLKLSTPRAKYVPSEILSTDERPAILAAVRSIPGSEPLRVWLEKP